ncbi:hypothetical protein KJ865_13640 [Myxococcota bacterium]|nr:hypothetical protein [Myxococcota bacterium]
MKHSWILLLLPLLFTACDSKKKAPGAQSAMELKKMCGHDDKEACRKLCTTYRSLPGCKKSCKLGDDFACKRQKALEVAIKESEQKDLPEQIGSAPVKWAPPKRQDPQIAQWHGELFSKCQAGYTLACDALAFYSPMPPSAQKGAKTLLAQMEAECAKNKASFCNILSAFELDRSFSFLSPPNAFVHSSKACALSHGKFGCTKAGEMALAGMGTAQNTTQGEALLKKGCDARDHAACYQLAKHLAYKEKTTSPYMPKVNALLYKACRAGNDDACSNLRCRFSKKPNRDVSPVTAKEGKELYTMGQQACAKGNEFGCLLETQMIARGLGTPKNIKKALASATGLCDKKYASACHIASVVTFFEKKDKLSNEQMAALAQKGCDLGLARSCLVLGNLKEKIKGVAASLAPLERACNMGSLTACLETGRAYESPKLGERNSAKSKQFYERSCNGGDMMGCGALMELIVKEELRDLEEKEKGFQRLLPLCAMKMVGMCGYLAYVLHKGWGVEADPAAAEKLARTRCQCGAGGACWAAGKLTAVSYFNRRLVGRVRYRARGNFKRSLEYYRKGCSAGHGGACAEFALALSKKALPSRHRQKYMDKNVKKNLKKAATIGCDQGWNNACLVKKQFD